MPDELKNTDTVVVGGGISGLCTAFRLYQQDQDVALLEASDRPGGVIQSKRMGSFLFEYGPNSLLKKSNDIKRLISELDLEEAMQVAGDQASRRYIVRDGQLQPVPMSVKAFLNTNLLSLSGKLSLLLEPLRKPGGMTDDETLASFVRRRLGEETLRYLVNPMIAGVYAGAPREMSAISGAEKFARWEREYGSILAGAMSTKLEQPDRSTEEEVTRELISFRGGLQTLTDRLSDRLSEVIYHERDVVSIGRSSPTDPFQITVEEGGDTSRETVSASRVVVSVPAYAAANLLEPFGHGASEALSGIDYPPVSVVHFGYENYQGDHPLDGFGFLVPEVEQRDILGSLWNASIFPNRAPDGGAVFTTFVGGARQPEMAGKTEDELVKRVREELEDLIGVDQRPDVVHVKRWERAIPQYNVGHQHIMERIDSFEDEHRGIHIHSNFRNGVSVPACIQNGFSLAERILQESG